MVQTNDPELVVFDIIVLTNSTFPVESRTRRRISTVGRLVEYHRMVYELPMYQTLPYVGE